MKVVLSWLHEFLSVAPSGTEVAEALTSHGVEVSQISDQASGLTNVVVAKIIEFMKHPDADRLSVCKVSDGENVFEVVCGAKNFKAGDHVALARVGAKLPNGLEIKKSKIRGVTSYGMLCSEEELGLKPASEGILILPEESSLGMNLGDYLGKKDVVLELELTPNRGDCLSVVGVAQEVAAIFKTSAKTPSIGMKAGDTGNLRALVKDPDLCPRYTLQYFDSVRVAPSPPKIAGRLESCGVRSISNVVDITNYVMIERGQPQHAFDADKVTGTIEVRRAQAGERIVCLDDVERELCEEDLIIADSSGPIGIAGVMGGKRTAVTEGTKAILLESAFFCPKAIRKTSKRLALHTESSHRFERFVDPTGCWSASLRSRELLLEHAGARPLDEFDADRNQYKPLKVNLKRSSVIRHLGSEIKSVGEYLTRLGFSVEKVEEDYVVEVPVRRPDITREIDLIEEIARLHGYDQLGAEIPPLTLGEGGDRLFARIRKILQFMAAGGYHEVRTFSFASSAQNRNQPFLSESPPHVLLNAIASGMDEMRVSLLPNLIECLKLNGARQRSDIRLFECGKVYLTDPVAERWHLGVLLAGTKAKSWASPEVAYDFFDLKGVFEALSSEFRLNLEFKPLSQPNAFLHPGKSVEIRHQNTVIGYLGAVHPKQSQETPFREFFVAEMSLTSVLPRLEENSKYQAFSAFPHSKRDFAFIVDKNIASEAVRTAILKLNIPIVRDLTVFDVYEGRKLPSGKKSLAYQVVFCSDERTLTDAEIHEAGETIVKHVASEFQAQLRS